MRSILFKFTVLFLFLVAPQVGAETTDWSKFRPSGAGFSVTMPGEPKPLDQGPPAWIWMSAVRGEYAYMVSYAVVPGLSKMSKSELDENVKVFIDTSLETAGITSKKQRKVKWKGLQCTDVDGEKNGSKSYARYIASPKNDRIYTLFVAGKSTPGERARFWNSLAFK